MYSFEWPLRFAKTYLYIHLFLTIEAMFLMLVNKEDFQRVLRIFFHDWIL